jgi:hypothetical protein
MRSKISEKNVIFRVFFPGDARSPGIGIPQEFLGILCALLGAKYAWFSVLRCASYYQMYGHFFFEIMHGILPVHTCILARLAHLHASRPHSCTSLIPTTTVTY